MTLRLKSIHYKVSCVSLSIKGKCVNRHVGHSVDTISGLENVEVLILYCERNLVSVQETLLFLGYQRMHFFYSIVILTLKKQTPLEMY